MGSRRQRPPPAAQAHSSGATSLARRGISARARIAERLSPGRAADGPAAILSPRELAIVQLAASRARNREIAEQLGLSTRTVESHLANAFKKLGITRRDELAEHLAWQPEVQALR